MSRYCTACGSERSKATRHCTSCGVAFSETAPSTTSPSRPIPPPPAPKARTDRWSDYDWGKGGRLFWGFVTTMSVVVIAAAGIHWYQHRLDGRYVCGDAGFPMSIEIGGDSGHMDFGVARIWMMRVERHGDTVSMSGGNAVGADGREIDSQTRAAITGGDDVDLLRLGNGGQTLTMELSGGKKAVFVKQP